MPTATPPPETAKLDITQWPRVTYILETTGIVDYSQIPNKAIYLTRGSDVHLITESIDRGEPDYWSDSDLSGYAKAWSQFRADTDFRPELIEHPVYHKVRRYKGRLDRLGRFGESKFRILLDIKSGIVADWVRLQLAAYAACFDRPEEIRRYGLQLKKDGTYRISEEFKDYRQDSNYFFSLVATVHGRSIYGKTTVED